MNSDGWYVIKQRNQTKIQKLYFWPICKFNEQYHCLDIDI